jgi:putative Holliday junction resolvase
VGSSPQQSHRVAAIDLGKTRVGIAVADELGMLAHPRPPLSGKNDKKLLEALCAMVEEEGVTRLLVGYPLSMSGREGVAAQRAARFCQRLADRTGVEVELVDERLTSLEAERRLAEAGASRADVKARVDGEAAAIILQQWLDAQQQQG